jgi:phage shock protein E
MIGDKALAGLLADKNSKVLLLDVRTAEEYADGHIPGAVLVPYDELAAKFKEADKGRPIVVYCRTGRRSAIAADTLKDMGYTNVSDFGGYTNWTHGLAKE